MFNKEPAKVLQDMLAKGLPSLKKLYIMSSTVNEESWNLVHVKPIISTILVARTAPLHIKIKAQISVNEYNMLNLRSPHKLEFTKVGFANTHKLDLIQCEPALNCFF